jgi:hypothetical protein
MKISIEDQEVNEKTGTSSKGNPYRIREQTAYAHIPGNRYPVKITVPLEDNQPAYFEGEYVVDDASFFVGRFDALTLGRLVLVPFGKK